jgi:hypothetical protein
MTTPDKPVGQPDDLPPAAAGSSRSASSGETGHRQRLSLPKLARTGPLRIMTTVGRFDDAAAGKGDGAAPGRPILSAKDVIAHGMRVAQEVMDQQMESGERILRHLRKAPMRKRRVGMLDMSTDSNLLERTLSLQQELSVLVLEVLETFVKTPAVVDVVSRWLGVRPREHEQDGYASGSFAPTPSGSESRRPRCALQVSSRKFNEASLDWFADAELDEPSVAGLHTVGAKPIDSIGFIAEPPAFRITIPDDQPDGTYAGVIVSKRSGRALGAITVKVSEK